ncbi:hypothetical protein EJB05_43911, partial [Eragrostis curvula]
MAPPLMGDLLEEVLLHLPPNDPGHLFRAALVCKDWCRAISGSGFRRRFLKVHRMAAPILGFIYRSSFKKTHFMPTISSTFRLVYREIPWSAIHALQSRILFYDMDYHVNLDLPLRTEVLSVTDGHDFVFIRMGSTIFTVDLKSGGVAKLFDGYNIQNVQHS